MARLAALTARWDDYKSIFYFLLKLGIIYVAWRLLMEMLGAQSAPAQQQVWPWLTLQWRAFNALLLQNLMHYSVELLNLLGYSTLINGDILYANNSPGVSIGYYCLGLELWALFSALILVYPAPFKHKLWFLPMGIVVIQALNILRIVGLSLLVLHAPDYVDFNHHFTFRIVVFLFILLMYWFFVNRYGEKQPDES